MKMKIKLCKLVNPVGYVSNQITLIGEVTVPNDTQAIVYDDKVYIPSNRDGVWLQQITAIPPFD